MLCSVKYGIQMHLLHDFNVSDVKGIPYSSIKTEPHKLGFIYVQIFRR